MKKEKIIIFGTGSFAEVVHFYLNHDSNYEVVAFTQDNVANGQDTFLGKPLVPATELLTRFSPEEHKAFVAVGYKNMNKLREQKCLALQELGYELIGYVSSRATHWGDTQIGKNVFIFEDNTIQPFVSIGDGTILWSGNHIGHHSTIGNYCFISSHCVVSGHCNIGNRCFVGVNATFGDSINIADDNLIGAGALLTKSTEPLAVYVGARATKLPKTSDTFLN